MPFLQLNGWTIPVAVVSSRKNWRQAGGSSSRTTRGALLDPKRNLRRIWEFQTIALEPQDAEGLVRLVSGEGHYFDFYDGLQASTGLQPSAAPPAGSRLYPASAGKNNSAGLLSLPSSGFLFRVDPQTKEWTVILSRLAGSSWVTGALRDDGIGYENGAQSQTWGKQSSGGVYFLPSGGALEVWSAVAPGSVDDLIVLPWRASVSQMAAWTASDAPRFGPLPVLRAQGDMAEGGRQEQDIFVVGEVISTEIAQMATQNGWVNNGRVVTFQIGEVDPVFSALRSYRQSEVSPAPVFSTSVSDSFEYAGGWPQTIQNPDYPSTFAGFDSPSDTTGAESFETAGGWPGT